MQEGMEMRMKANPISMPTRQSSRSTILIVTHIWIGWQKQLAPTSPTLRRRMGFWGCHCSTRRTRAFGFNSRHIFYSTVPAQFHPPPFTMFDSLSGIQRLLSRNFRALLPPQSPSAFSDLSASSLHRHAVDILPYRVSLPLPPLQESEDQQSHCHVSYLGQPYPRHLTTYPYRRIPALHQNLINSTSSHSLRTLSRPAWLLPRLSCKTLLLRASAYWGRKPQQRINAWLWEKFWTLIYYRNQSALESILQWRLLVFLWNSIWIRPQSSTFSSRILKANRVDFGPLDSMFQFVLENPNFKPPVGLKLLNGLSFLMLSWRLRRGWTGMQPPVSGKFMNSSARTSANPLIVADSNLTSMEQFSKHWRTWRLTWQLIHPFDWMTVSTVPARYSGQG